MEIIYESFQRWFNGNELTADETTNIVMSIILFVLLIVTIVMLVYISIRILFWNRIGWFFEDLWHWFRRYTSPIPSSFLCEEDLSEEDIHEVMNIIHDGNPPKYEIKKTEDGINYIEMENQEIKHQQQ